MSKAARRAKCDGARTLRVRPNPIVLATIHVPVITEKTYLLLSILEEGHERPDGFIHESSLGDGRRLVIHGDPERTAKKTPMLRLHRPPDSA